MRVIVTRPHAQAEPLAERLRELGHTVVICPLLEIEPLGPEPVVVDGFDWIDRDERERGGRARPPLHGHDAEPG